MINQVVILVGGLGTRLANLVKKTPKPLLKINNIPFLDYLIKYYTNYGFKKIVLLTKYKHYIFHKKYHNKIINFSKIKCIQEKTFLGTSGSLKKVINKLDKKFIFCNGDTFFNINLFTFFKQLKHNHIGILACSEIQSQDKRYTYFNVNNKKLISSGVYLFNKKKIKKYLIDKGSLENDVLHKLPKNQFKKISFKKKFIDIGTPGDYQKAKKFLLNINKKKCAFLDRDGVINYDYGYVHKKENFVFKKNVIKAIKLLNRKNYHVIVISNQSGIGRGYYKEKDVIHLHGWINKKLNFYGANIDKFYYSPYFAYSKNKKYRIRSVLRKPNIGLFQKAFNEFNIIKKGSFFIGDRETDRITAKNFKIKHFNVDNDTDLYNFIEKKLNL